MADYGDSAKSYDLAREPLGCDIILEAFGNVMNADEFVCVNHVSRTLIVRAEATEGGGSLASHLVQPWPLTHTDQLN